MMMVVIIIVATIHATMRHAAILVLRIPYNPAHTISAFCIQVMFFHCAGDLQTCISIPLFFLGVIL